MFVYALVYKQGGRYLKQAERVAECTVQDDGQYLLNRHSDKNFQNAEGILVNFRVEFGISEFNTMTAVSRLNQVK